MNIGYSQVDSPLVGFAPVLGVYGIGVLLAISAGLLGYVVTQPRRWFWLGLIATIYGVGVGLRAVEWSTSSGKELRVALIQGNVAQAIKWSIEERQKTLTLYASLTQPYWGADLIVWPETAVPAFNTQVEPYLQQLQSQAAAAGSDMLVGIPYRDTNSGRYFNSVISLGRAPGVYHKQHLVPFGEYMPFPALLGPLLEFLDIPMSSFSSGGAQQPLLTVAGQHVGISICYEDVFGEEVITALPTAGLLVNVSNDAWFGDSMAPHQHLQMARMRALESGRYMLRATNTGISAVIDAKGTVRAVAPQFQSTGLAAVVQPNQGATPFVRGGNRPALLLALGALAFVYRRNRNTIRAIDVAAT
jgi:apolipoprotein N-acyltransferase